MTDKEKGDGAEPPPLLPLPRDKYIKWEPDAWRLSRKVKRMRRAEVKGVYHALLMAQCEEGKLPVDFHEMAIAADLTLAELKRAWPLVSCCFQEIVIDGKKFLYNLRMAQAIVEAVEATDRARKAGDASAKARAAKGSRKRTSNGRSNSRSTDVQHTLNHTVKANVSAYSLDSGFEKFYTQYPKKEKKPKAREAWDRLAPDEALCDRILADVAARCRTRDWLKENGRYIPQPASYLNAARWEDEGVVGLEPENPGDYYRDLGAEEQERWRREQEAEFAGVEP